MDRTSWIGVIACFVVLLGWSFYSQYHWAAPVPKPVAATESVSSPVQETPAQDNPSLSNATPSAKLPEQKIPANAGPEQIVTLENDLMAVHFTSLGGAIKTIELKKHADEGNSPVTLNRNREDGIFNLVGWDGDFTQVPYTLTTQGDEVTFQRTLPSGAVLKRTYRLGSDYEVRLVQQISNSTGKDLTLPAYRLNIGTAGPLHPHDNPTYTMASYCRASDLSFHKIAIGQFSASGFLGFSFHEARTSIDSEGGPLLWGAVKNQFFALILAPLDDLTLQSVDMHPVKLPAWGPKSTVVPEGIRSEAVLPALTIPAGKEINQQFSLYSGPKEYSILKKLGQHQALVMDFGMFGWVIKPLLFIMRSMHSFIPSWGWTIIAMTVLIKVLLWPLQNIANHSMKQMQALQPKVQQMREKYKDDPQKMNTEMISLYREYGVNPAGGCLPMLVQMPIFIGFYFMLQGAVELRGASFFWIHDLVQPDTIAHIPGFGWDVNPLPLLMTATQILLMRMTPQSGDNAQVKMMQWMPLVLLFVLYNFAAALALYWTVSNLISMVQTYMNLRKPVPVLKRTPKKKLA